MRHTLWGTLLLVLVFVAPGASAGRGRVQKSDTAEAVADSVRHAAEPSVSAETFNQDPSTGSGDPYIMTCVAYAPNQLCWTCVLNRFGKRVCGRANYSAQCYCNNEQREGAGPGITDCFAAGACSYY